MTLTLGIELEEEMTIPPLLRFGAARNCANSSSLRWTSWTSSQPHPAARKGKMETKLRKFFEQRIKWLMDKELEMRRPNSPDYTPNELLWGRVQGQIGEAKFWLDYLAKAGSQ